MSSAENTLEDRRRERRQRLVANRAASFAEADAWDLEFWQRRTPEERLSALLSIQRDVALVEASRATAAPAEN